MAFSGPSPKGNEGTARVELQVESSSPLVLNGCLVDNDENFKEFINDYNLFKKFKKSKTFVYFYCPDETFSKIRGINIIVYKFKKEKIYQSKMVPIANERELSSFIISNGCHRFLTANFAANLDKDFNNKVKSSLKRFAKKLPGIVHRISKTGTYKAINYMKIPRNNLQFIEFVPIKLVLGQRFAIGGPREKFEKLENGPILYNDELVGYCTKDNNKTDEIRIDLLTEKQVTVPERFEVIFQTPQDAGTSDPPRNTQTPAAEQGSGQSSHETQQDNDTIDSANNSPPTIDSANNSPPTIDSANNSPPTIDPANDSQPNRSQEPPDLSYGDSNRILYYIDDDLLHYIKTMISRESINIKGWESLAKKFEVDAIDIQAIRTYDSEKRGGIFIEKLQTLKPGLTLGEFVKKLDEINRKDVSKHIKEFYYKNRK